MPDLDITIGGRVFSVACQAGEEHLLRSAAQLLDNEAQPLLANMGRMPELKMLLMAGLMLADRTAAQEDELRKLRVKIDALETRPEPEPKTIKVEVVPPEVTRNLAEMAARAEALANQLDEKLAKIS